MHGNVSLNRRTILTTLAGIAVAQAAGLVGLILMGSGLRDWYPKLKRPSYNPPGWVFGPVWTALYTLMGIAVAVVWRREAGERRTLALTLFGTQLLLNALWSGAFFGLRSPLAGLADMLALWLAIVATMIVFMTLSPLAALLLVPYLVWVSFASLLNFAVWRRNR